MLDFYVRTRTMQGICLTLHVWVLPLFPAEYSKA